MRKPALEEVPELEIPERTSLASLEVTLITRLFGGGAKARELDEISWLRSAALKSALRFWWRAGHAHNYGSLKELREREEHLFGASAVFAKKDEILGGPGVLSVQVASGPVDDRTYGKGLGEGPGSPLNVAYFPARAQSGGVPARKLGWPGAHATLDLWACTDCDTEKAELLQSLRLWLTLGGVGARTRRGAGAIGVSEKLAAATIGVSFSRADLDGFLSRVCQPQTQLPHPSLFSLAQTLQVFVGRPFDTGEEAQRKLLSILKGVRQDRHPGVGEMPGRSKWPEPNAIRLLFNADEEWRHKPDRKDAELYPRAALGLPIVMHFKDDPPSEPPEHRILGTLDPAGLNPLQRYASPVIIRPVKVWETSGPKFVPVALITRGTLPKSALPLIVGPSGDTVVRSYPITTRSDALQKVVNAFAKDHQFHSLL